jgi:hypothetical protein
MNETLLRIQTEMIYAAMTGAMRLPDPVLAELLSQFRNISGILSGGGGTDEQQALLDELEGYFRTPSELSEALRNMILVARPSQVKSFIRGYLVNYVYDL